MSWKERRKISKLYLQFFNFRIYKDFSTPQGLMSAVRDNILSQKPWKDFVGSIFHDLAEMFNVRSRDSPSRSISMMIYRWGSSVCGVLRRDRSGCPSESRPYSIHLRPGKPTATFLISEGLRPTAFSLTGWLGTDSTSDALSVKLRGRVFSARAGVPRSHGTSGTI